MKTLIPLAAIAILVGCAAEPESEPLATPNGASAPQVNGRLQLGEQHHGAFDVTLTVEPSPPLVGTAEFTVIVLHHGSPTPTARVMLDLSMPAMDMGGPTVEMTHVGDGVYTASAPLSMAGEWQAIVRVDEHGHPEEATYVFVIPE